MRQRESEMLFNHSVRVFNVRHQEMVPDKSCDDGLGEA